MTAINHSSAFRQKVVDLKDSGLTAREVARQLNGEYLKVMGKPMTKNAVIGICHRSRYYEYQKEEPYKPVSVAELMEKIKTLRPAFRIRKCLRCKQNTILERPLYICDSCKDGKSYKSAASLGDYTYHGT
jgi:hypothetical protein|tara:strand:+ start:2627 stop:3016 length:390 start_codon:yes stop_codon:yes gene_type:complete